MSNRSLPVRMTARAVNLHLQRRQRMQFMIFRRTVGYEPDAAFPRRHHEKMLWRKIFDRNPLFAVFCDKLATKDYAAARTDAVRIPRALWVGERARDIPPSLLARKVFIKCNHGCNFNWLWEPGTSDLARIDREAGKCMEEVYGRWNMEAAYEDVPRRVFVEEFIESGRPEGLVDINIRCSDVEPILASLITRNKAPGMKVGYFHADGSPFHWRDPNNRGASAAQPYCELPAGFVPPPEFHRAVEAARALSRGVDYARFDFLAGNSGLCMGEITVYPAAGVSRAPRQADEGPDAVIAKH